MILQRNQDHMLFDSIKDPKLQLVVMTITAIGNFFFDSPKRGGLLDAIFQVKKNIFILSLANICNLQTQLFFFDYRGVYFLEKSLQPHPPMKIFYLLLLGKFYVYMFKVYSLNWGK